MRVDEREVSNCSEAYWCSTEHWQIRELLAQQGFDINNEDVATSSWKLVILFAGSKLTMRLTMIVPGSSLNILWVPMSAMTLTWILALRRILILSAWDL